MKCLVSFLITFLILSFSDFSEAYAPFGRELCKTPGYFCLKIKKKQTWENTFKDATQRFMVMALNRMNTPLYAGISIAVPENIAKVSLMDFSPFPYQIKTNGQKVIFIDPSVLAWGAYDSSGELVRWGPASLGSHFCADLGQRCHSPIGTFHVYRKGSADCKSTKFPLLRGGAPMPYCMFFYRGFALHGEPNGLPSDHASHGCVRLFVEDAEWLNKQFVEIGTLIVIEPYGDFSTPQTGALKEPPAI